MFCVACVLLSVIAILVYKFITWNHDYFMKRNVPHEKPKLLFGSFKDQILGKKHFAEIHQEIYNNYHDDVRYVGFLRLNQPSILIRDPDLIKDVLTTNFNSFANNEFQVDPKVDPILAYNPFFQRGEAWKKSRGHFTPSVTGSKIKHYLVGMEEICNELIKYIRSQMDENGKAELEGKLLAGKYTTDVTAKAVFGLDNNTFEDENSTFHELTSSIFSSSFLENLKFMLSMFVPKLTEMLKVRFIPQVTEDRILKITRGILAHRKETGITRNDFFQQMITYREKDTNNVFTDEYIASQSFGFIGDGYETSSTTIAYVLYQLAWNQDVQDKLRIEINKMMKETGGKLSYDHIHAMQYLDMVVSETLRLHPPGVALGRTCSKEYVFPPAIPGGESLKVELDTVITIPVYALHMDPKYFPEPEKFDPERFTDEAVESRHKFVYLPFGEGPRICLGIRYALTQTKAALVSVLYNFKVKPSPKTSYPVRMDPYIVVMRPLNGAWIEYHDANK